MPSQKNLTIDPSDPLQVQMLFRLAEALVMEGWGATVIVNTQRGVMSTNAPANYLDMHAQRLVQPYAS